ncbi:BRCT domain-containing protein [Hyaloraphidium curvatum]|nr:BRCT domain-containing protein [Hyaloraphidium curvatum]
MLFKGVVYWLSPNLGVSRYTALADLLDRHGARPADEGAPDYRSDASLLVRARAFEVDAARVTHVVTPDTDFPAYVSLLNNPDVAIVTPQWVERAAKNGFLHDPHFYSPNPEKYFSGVVVTTTGGISSKDRDAIFASVEAFGGQTRKPLTKDVTHLVTLQPSGDKYKAAMDNAELGIVVVLPNYFVDCSRVRKLLDPDLYRFPDPPVLHPDPKRYIKVAEVVEDAAVQGMPVASRFLQGVRFFFDAPSVPRFYQDKLARAGATIAQEYSTDGVDVVILTDTGSHYFHRAEEEGKIVASGEWLKDIFIAERMLPSKGRLLHYPPPPSQMVPDAAREMVISITNYSGRAREDLRRMIGAIGATYTPTMTPNNTHLICAVPAGAKFQKAGVWDVATVNHLWLEESYQQWKLQAVTKPQYQAYPEGLAETVGDSPMPQEVVNRFLDLARGASSSAFIPPESQPGVASTQLLSLARSSPTKIPSQPRSRPPASSQPPPRDEAAGDAAPDEENVPVPVIHVSIPDSGRPPTQPPADSQSPPQRQRDKQSLPADGVLVPASGQQSAPRDSQAARRESLASAPRESQPAARESQPVPRRESQPASPSFAEPVGAARQASNAGSQASPTAAGEPARKTSRKRRLVDASDLGSESSRRKSRGRAASGSPEPIDVGQYENVNPASARKGRQVAIAFTGIKPTDKEAKGIRALGGTVVDQMTEATHLLTTRVTRTEKFLMAVGGGLHILDRSWLDSSLQAGMFLDESLYPLRDPDSERQHKYNLQESLRRARTTKLLQGRTVYMTPNSKPEVETMRHIVEANGGKFVVLTMRKARDVSTAGAIVLSCPEDSAYFPEFVDQGVEVYSTEYILSGVLRQELPVDEFVQDMGTGRSRITVSR